VLRLREGYVSFKEINLYPRKDLFASQPPAGKSIIVPEAGSFHENPAANA
jgi:hypothetical protein